MTTGSEQVERHYGRGKILDSILEALARLGKDLTRLTPADLAPVDEFHIRGREATVELAARAGLTPGLRVLDVGCGLGGSARYVASELGCRATGVDLTGEYVEAAQALARLVGLQDAVDFQQASALDLPFPHGAFDVAWTEHAQMNIADKGRFYAEIAQVLRPGGRLLFHDVFAGHGGEVHFPVPWAENASISSLAPPAAVRAILEGLHLRVVDWEDTTRQSLAWFAAVVARIGQSGPPPLGIHLLMGDTAAVKLRHMVRNLEEDRVAVIQAVVEKPAAS